MDHFRTSLDIIRTLGDLSDYPDIALRKATHLLKSSLSAGYDPTDGNYYLFNCLIQKEGLSPSIVYPFLQELIKQPEFTLKKDDTHHPTETLMCYLAGSSYWLDKKLFNEKAVLKSENTFSDKDVIRLLDIGCVLLQKGFEFPDLTRVLNPEIVSYMKTYIDMTYQRLHSLYQRPHFLSNAEGKPISFFHGTTHQFDGFLPLSHFTPNRQVAANYAKQERHAWEYGNDTQEVNKLVLSLEEQFKNPTQKPNIVIPTYLKISHPFKGPAGHLPTAYREGGIYAFLRFTNTIGESKKKFTLSLADFIFKNPFEISDDAVHHELKLDNLYQAETDDKLNRSHLVKQRFIHFWESFGFDSFEYELGDKGKAFVVFRPQNIYRLDRPDLFYKPKQISRKRELEQIRDRYLRAYRPKRIETQEIYNRMGAVYLWNSR